MLPARPAERTRFSSPSSCSSDNRSGSRCGTTVSGVSKTGFCLCCCGREVGANGITANHEPVRSDAGADRCAPSVASGGLRDGNDGRTLARMHVRRRSWSGPLRRFVGGSVFELFEHVVMLVMALLITIVVAFATWHLVLQVLFLVSTGRLDPADPVVFRDLFAMFFTVVIALELRRSFLIVTVGEQSVVRVRSILLIGLLATVRRLIVLDLKEFHMGETFAIAGVILALGSVFWLVRDQDRRQTVTVAPARSEREHAALP
jgi:uncharacterized membrane protein (DUF373 family)